MNVLQQAVKQSKKPNFDGSDGDEDSSSSYVGKGKGKAKDEPEDVDLGDLAVNPDNWEPSSKMLKMVSRNRFSDSDTSSSSYPL